MQTIIKSKMRAEIVTALRKQGYKVHQNTFVLRNEDRDAKRNVHLIAKSERISQRKEFILKKSSLIEKYLLDGNKIEIDKIKPKLIEVSPDSEWETLFRWWNLVWWSLPYEHAYGRQMRFVVWDQYHNAPIGLIGLQSPILSWSVRDDHLGIPPAVRDYWVNQSLSAQRLGALPPYNYALGGKLVAYLMTSDIVRNKYRQKYTGLKTVLQKRKLPAGLLFITTTGAYGKSSVYTRLKYQDQYVARFIGYTQGSGSFHIPNALFDNLVSFLQHKGYDVRRGYGSGPSRKLRLIDQALKLLEFDNGAVHGVKRAVYLFPFVKNLTDVIQKNKSPKWHHRTVKGLTDFWKKRWAIPRTQSKLSYLDFSAKNFMKQVKNDLNHPERICKGK